MLWFRCHDSRKALAGLKFTVQAATIDKISQELYSEGTKLFGVLPRSGIDETNIKFSPSDTLVKGYVSLFGAASEKENFDLARSYAERSENLARLKKFKSA